MITLTLTIDAADKVVAFRTLMMIAEGLDRDELADRPETGKGSAVIVNSEHAPGMDLRSCYKYTIKPAHYSVCTAERPGLNCSPDKHHWVCQYYRVKPYDTGHIGLAITGEQT